MHLYGFTEEIDCKATNRGRTVDQLNQTASTGKKINKFSMFSVPRAMKAVLCCAKILECCYQILQIMIQIGCKTFLGSLLAAYRSKSETYQYLPG